MPIRDSKQAAALCLTVMVRLQLCGDQSRVAAGRPVVVVQWSSASGQLDFVINSVQWPWFRAQAAAGECQGCFNQSHLPVRRPSSHLPVQIPSSDLTVRRPSAWDSLCHVCPLVSLYSLWSSYSISISQTTSYLPGKNHRFKWLSSCGQSQPLLRRIWDHYTIPLGQFLCALSAIIKS